VSLIVQNERTGVYIPPFGCGHYFINMTTESGLAKQRGK